MPGPAGFAVSAWRGWRHALRKGQTSSAAGARHIRHWGSLLVAIFLFVDAWNEYMIALTVISSAEQRTLPVQITNFIGIGRVEWGPVMAFSLIVATPAVILFAVAQRHMVSGLMSGFSK